MRYPVFTLFVLLNVLLPLGAAAALDLFVHYQRQFQTLRYSKRQSCQEQNWVGCHNQCGR